MMRALPGRLAQLVPLAAGAADAAGLGCYGRFHDPSGRSFHMGLFSSVDAMKSWLATAAIALFGAQLLSGAMMGGWMRPRRTDPEQLAHLHRLLGALAFATSLPVAFHCLWSLGYQTASTRIALHSVFGCAAYGAFAAKALAARRGVLPRKMLTIVGATVAALFVASWWSSGLWWLTHTSRIT